MERVEMAAGDIVTYAETTQITAQALVFMCDAMVKNLNDPVLVTEILDEMTEHANRMLEPLGYGIDWRMP